MFGPPDIPGTTLSGHDLRFPRASWVKDLKYLGPLFDEVTARSRIASLVRVEGEILSLGAQNEIKLRCTHYADSAHKALVDVQREAATLVRQIAPSRKDRENGSNDDSAESLARGSRWPPPWGLGPPIKAQRGCGRRRPILHKGKNHTSHTHAHAAPRRALPPAAPPRRERDEESSPGGRPVAVAAGSPRSSTGRAPPPRA